MPRGTQRRTRTTPTTPPTFTAAQCREADRLASEVYALPTLLLMEHAGQSVADECRRTLVRMTRSRQGSTKPQRPTILVLCGPGNNGGDGLVVARRLNDLVPQAKVRIILAAPPERFQGDAAMNMTIVDRLRIPFAVWTNGIVPTQANAPLLIVDALLGTGVRPPLREPIASMVNWINATRQQRTGTRVVAIDVPSGMDAGSGECLGPCVRADVTVSLMGLKPGLRTPAGRRLAGRVVVGDIGMPRVIKARIERS